MSRKLQKVAYKPVGLLLGIGAGALAGFVFREIWKMASGDDDAIHQVRRAEARVRAHGLAF